MSTLAAEEYLNQTFHLESDGGFYILAWLLAAKHSIQTKLSKSFTSQIRIYVTIPLLVVNFTLNQQNEALLVTEKCK